MNIVVERDTFAACLSRVAPFAAKSTIPVLECVKLEASGQMKLIASATDMDASISETIAASSDEPWTVCVPADRLRSLVSGLPSGSQVTLTKDGVRLSLRSGHTKAAFDIERADAFPEFKSEFPDTPQFSVKAGELDRVMAMLIPSVSDRNERPYLCGIHLCLERKGISAVSTDGYRGTFARMINNGELHDFPSIILPRNSCVRLRSLIKGFTGAVDFFVSASQIRMVGPNWALTGKLIDGIFPDHNRWIAPKLPAAAGIKADDLSPAIERALPLLEGGANLKFRGIHIKIERGVLLLRGGPIDAPVIQDQLDAEYDGDPVDVGCNAKYMRDAIAALGGGELELHVTDPTTPFRVNGRGEEDECVTIFPARV